MMVEKPSLAGFTHPRIRTTSGPIGRASAGRSVPALSQGVSTQPSRAQDARYDVKGDQAFGGRRDLRVNLDRRILGEGSNPGSRRVGIAREKQGEESERKNDTMAGCLEAKP